MLNADMQKAVLQNLSRMQNKNIYVFFCICIITLYKISPVCVAKLCDTSQNKLSHGTMSTYHKFRSTTTTFKLSHNGYIYNRRNGYKGSIYWYCDQKSVCSASLIERDGKFLKGRPSRWNEDGTHKSHEGNLQR